MSKARNLRKLARRYSELARTDIMCFRREWDRRVLGWLYEIQNRVRCLREGELLASEADNSAESSFDERETVRLGIFDLYYRADDLIAACGKEVEQLVGAKTRAELLAECKKGVDIVYGERRLYKRRKLSRKKK